MRKIENIVILQSLTMSRDASVLSLEYERVKSDSVRPNTDTQQVMRLGRVTLPTSRRGECGGLSGPRIDLKIFRKGNFSQ